MSLNDIHHTKRFRLFAHKIHFHDLSATSHWFTRYENVTNSEIIFQKF